MTTMGLCTDASIGTPVLASDGTPLSCAPSLQLRAVTTQELQTLLWHENLDTNQAMLSQAWGIGFSGVLASWLIAVLVGRIIRMFK